MKLADATPEERAALRAYAGTFGKGWKRRLTEQAWLLDWREQWGVLRNVRNTYEDAFDHKALDAAVKP